MGAQAAQGKTSAGGTERSSARVDLRFAAIPLLSLAFVILLVGLLNYYKFQTTFQDVAERRFAMVLERAESAIEKAVDLGLRLEDIAAAPKILGSLAFQDWRVEDAFIFESEGGRIVFALDPNVRGMPAPPEVLEAQAREPGGRWRLAQNGRMTVGARLDSGYGTGIGGVALTYSLAGIRADARQLRQELLLAMTATFVLSGLLALAGLHFLARDYRVLAGRIRTALAKPGEAGTLPGDIGPMIVAYHQKTRQAAQELDALEKGAGGAPAGKGAVS